MKPSKNKVPKHLGIIIDGNRRFAKRLMLKPWQGHEWGAKKIEQLFEWCRELGIKETTIYAFSLENFDRPKKEFNYLMKIFENTFNKFAEDKRLKDYNIRIKAIGRINLFPESVQKAIRRIEEFTKNNSEYLINFALAYSGRAEIIDATKKIAEEVKSGRIKTDDINEKVFENNIYLNSEPDLIIRTSGEHRTSGFLLWQGSYAELYFSDKMWPEFEKEDFLKAVESFKNRERRFGK